MEKGPIVEMKNIVKIYPDGTVALRGVNFKVYEGEIVGLLGENGAGKTTLMKILSGLLRPTKGEILYKGRKVKFKNPSDALTLGIGMVHQHFTLVPIFTALQNIILGVEFSGKDPVKLMSPINPEIAAEKIKKLMSETGLEVPLDVPVELLPLGMRQRIEILKVLYRGVRVLILDEPTTFLTPLEVEELFKIMNKLKEQGKTVIFITHKIREALAITDRIVVLRHGLVAGEIPTVEASPEKLAVLMVGKEMKLDITLRGKGVLAKAPTVLKVENLYVKNDLGLMAVKGVSFEVKAGEIFGIAGVEGNGQAELVEAITGLRKVEKGKIVVNGVEVTNKGPIDVYRLGASHIPGDREKYGLVLEFTVAENSIMSRQWESGFLKEVKISEVLKLSRLNWKKVKEYTLKLVKSFNVITPSIDTIAKSLSGGNRQRLLVGRELSKNPNLIVAVHPTRGLDIASTLYIRQLLAKMRDEGKAVLLVSADLDEIMQLSDRIAVMYEGKFMGVKKAEEVTRKEIGLMMGGVKV
ncbi:MAG: ABC transporter ATP-binding protein [Thermoprotei archaeon]|nr:MAG: ABC transporter ATP-binding protein [Thermoprotei archaeon]